MENQPAKQYRRVDFEININNKLLCTVFSYITPTHRGFLFEEVCDIRINGQFFCYAKVVRTQNITLKTLIDSGLYLSESGLVTNDLYFRHMENLYSNKPWWNGNNSNFQIVHFKKIQQLSIFEDGIYETRA